MKVWEVSDVESGSDHKYVKFTIQYDNTCYHRHKLETKHAKIDKYIRKVRNKYIKELKKVGKNLSVTENLSSTGDCKMK